VGSGRFWWFDHHWGHVVLLQPLEVRPGTGKAGRKTSAEASSSIAGAVRALRAAPPPPGTHRGRLGPHAPPKKIKKKKKKQKKKKKKSLTKKKKKKKKKDQSKEKKKIKK
jgi:hypothetical protein